MYQMTLYTLICKKMFDLGSYDLLSVSSVINICSSDSLSRQKNLESKKEVHLS